ncbi:hypothetical protein F8S13_16745 [Chloroflexia bacterium SDU3-3]|nr:hypothetical protein F8S13_16745 [Chloroflexia bacterium SDU3-3]
MTPRSVPTFEAAPLDSYAERITTGVAMLGGILMLPALFSYLSRIPIPAAVVAVGIAAALAIFLLLNYAIQPTRYEIGATELIIRRRLWRRVRLPYKQLLGVSEAAAMAEVPRVGLRSAFNAGVFGYEGPFQLQPYGKIALSATNRERLVALARIDHMPLLISPAKPRDFVAALREALQRADP